MNVKQLIVSVQAPLVLLEVYPDADPEVSSVDGWVAHTEGTEVSWATLVAAAGNDSEDSLAARIIVFLEAAVSDTDKWRELRRGILLFDTSAIPDGANILSVVLSVYCYQKSDELAIAPDVNVYASAPAVDTALANGDFDSLGATPFSTAITFDDMVVGAYNDFILNTAGKAAISKTGITKLGLKNANYDVANNAPSWIANKSSGFYFYMSEQGGDFRPKLAIIYYV